MLTAKINNSQVSLSVSAGTIAPEKPSRRRITILNMDDAINIYIGKATVTLGNGMLIPPGGSISLFTTALIQGIAESGTPVVCYIEEHD